jgi:hypothetical protein
VFVGTVSPVRRESPRLGGEERGFNTKSNSNTNGLPCNRIERFNSCHAWQR